MKKRKQPIEQPENFIRSFTQNDDTAFNFLKAAVDKHLRTATANMTHEQRDAALKKEWDRVEHIHSWIMSSLKAHNKYNTDPNHKDAQKIDWIEHRDEQGRPYLLLQEDIGKLYQRAENWSKEQQARVNITDLTDNVTTIKTFPDGCRIVQLHSTDDLRREGKLMGHCVGDGAYDHDVENGYLNVYSLRDPQNNPHATIGVQDNIVEQSKGKNNVPPIKKYMPYLQEFFIEQNFELEEELTHTGMLMLDGKAQAFTTLPPGTHFDHINLKDCYWLEKWPTGVTANTISAQDLITDEEDGTKKIHPFLPSFFYSLPSNLETLIAESCINFDGAKLPQDLRALTVTKCKNFNGENLPYNLQRLTTVWCKNFNGRNLPQNLETLNVESCISFNGKDLPQKLKTLIVNDSQHFNGQNLPTSLESLSITWCNEFDGKDLPKNLKSLTIETSCHNFDAQNLPQNLTSLFVRNCDNFEGKKLPENLEDLTVEYCDNFTTEDLPQNLKAITIKDCPKALETLDETIWDIEKDHKERSITLRRKQMPMPKSSQKPKIQPI